MTARGVPEEMISRAARGDGNALAEVFQLYRFRLRQAVAMRIDPRLRRRIDPSDVVQEAFLDALRRLEAFAAQIDRMPLLLWLRLLAVQRLVELHRQHLGAQIRDASLEISLHRSIPLAVSSVWLLDQLVDQHDSGCDAAIRREIQQQVQSALNQMAPLDREVLAMRHFERLTNQEVAIALGISVTASSNRYIRALRRLKAILTPIADEG